MKKYILLTLTFLLSLSNLSINAQSFHEDDKEGLRIFLRQSSSISGKMNIEHLGLNASDTISWRTSEDWVKKLEDPKALTYLDWEWSMGANSRLIRLEIKSFDDSKSQLSGTLDCTKFAELEELNCSNSELLNMYVNDNTKLRTLNCAGNKLTNLELTRSYLLGVVDCSNNELSELDILTNPNLRHLNCSDNNLSILDLSKNLDIKSLTCSNNGMAKLILPKSTSLESLVCSDNNLTELEITDYENLKLLSYANNKLKSVNFSKNIQLESIYLFDNELPCIDISKNQNLLLLNVSNNILPKLEVEQNNALKYLYCEDNQLNKLSVLANSNLEVLNLSHNKIETLNLTNNTLLEDLNSSFNLLNEMSVASSSTAFVSLVCNDNNLTFATIPLDLINTSTSELVYAPQNQIDLGQFQFIDVIDMSDQYNIKENTSTYNWFLASADPASITDLGNGRFSAILNENLSYYCEVTNPVLPLLTLKYNLSVAKDSTTGVVDPEKDSDVLVHYDKNSGMLIFVNPDQIKSVDIYDTLGRIVQRVNQEHIQSGLSVQHLHTGVYLIRINLMSGKSVTTKTSI